MNKIRLHCSCCGDNFRAWDGYVDQDQDRGYGICKPCQDSIEAASTEMMDHTIGMFADSLNDDNRDQFLLFSRRVQEIIIHKALDQGLITWRIQ